MLKLNSEPDVIHKLATHEFAHTKPLIDYAGFAADSPYAGQPRQTFSLFLTTNQYHYIQQQAQLWYDQIRKDIAA